MKAKLHQRNLVIVLKQVRDLDERIMGAAEKGLSRGLAGAVTISQREFLSGPRPKFLDVRTTRLRQSIVYKVTRTPRGVIGRMGTNVKYARYHELGFHGTVQVAGHIRAVDQVVSRNETGKARKVITDAAGRVIGIEGRKSAARRQRTGVVLVQFVKPHSRNLKYDGRPFIRPAIKKALPMILEEVRRELDQVREEGK